MTKSRGYVVQVHFNRNRADTGLPWTVHYRGQCIPANRVVFKLPTETVYRPEKRTNPRARIKCIGAVMTLGSTNEVTLTKASAD